MDIDIVGLIVHWLLYFIGGLFVGAWNVALQHPWTFLIPAGLVGFAFMGSRSHMPVRPRRRRRYGYR